MELSFSEAAKAYVRDGRAANLSMRTLKIREYTYDYFGRWLESNERSLFAATITRTDVQDFLEWLKSCDYAEWTIRNHYLRLHALFQWLVDEDEIPASPCERMKPPSLTERVTPLMSDTDIKALIRACEGRTFEDRRDMALVRLMLDTGLRRSEVAGIQLEHINWDERTIVVLGKGRIEREIAFGRKADAALNKYMMARARHRYAELPDLWLTYRGAMNKETIRFILDRRAKAAGIEHIWPHLLRHQFTHLYLEAGGQERNVMKLNGWRSPAMLERYGSQLAAKRAQDEHRKMSPGDRF